MALRDARTPVVLIALTLAIVAGVVAWLTLVDASPSDRTHQARVDIALGDVKPQPATSDAKATVPAAGAPVDAQASAAPALTPTPPIGAGALTPPPAPAEPAAAAPGQPLPAPPPKSAPAPAAATARPSVPVQPPQAPPAPQPEARVVETTLTAPKLPRAATGPALTPAPDPTLVRTSAVGMLPIIGSDGRAPWKVYARPFDRADSRPRIAIVVTGLGLSSAATEAAIQGLPGAVTLAFAPYADDLPSWISAARAAGHEVLLNVPMEPIDYPRNDPGPLTLLTSLDGKANVERLEWMLGRAAGYVGIADLMGSRFTASRRNLRPVLQALAERGLMYVDSRSATDSAVPDVAREVGVPWAQSTQSIDDVVARAAIDARLADLERRAREQGRAIGVGGPYPATLERIAQWAVEVDKKGFVLAPVSAFAVERKSQ